MDPDEQTTTIIEINGVKLEVDLRSAKRIDTLRVGSRVKCLIKEYQAWKTCPGVVVGFEPFQKLPTMVVAWLDNRYSSDNLLQFKSYNAQTEDFEVVADLDYNALEVDKEHIVAQFDREIERKRQEVGAIEDKRQFFIAHFGRYFAEK